MDCIWENLEKVGPPFFQIYGMSVNTCIRILLPSWKIILSCYVAMILQIKDSWVVYHLPKKSGNFGRNVNGKTIFFFPNGNFHGKTGFLER